MTGASPRQLVAAVALVLAIWSVAWLAVHAWSEHQAVAVGAAFDFVITASVTMWLVTSRRPPRWLVGTTLAVGVLFARLVLGRVAGAGALVLGAGIALELALVISLVVSLRKARVAFRRARAAGDAGFVALTAALEATRAPRVLARVIATELYVFAMVVVGWRRPTHVARGAAHELPTAAFTVHRTNGAAHEPTAAVFTVHRTNGWSLYAGVLVFLTLVETTAVHLAVAAYVSNVLAWTLTLLSIYSALWLIGDALALRHGGIFVREHEIELRIGVRWQVRIPRERIASLEPTQLDRKAIRAAGGVDASILGANTLLHLAAPVTLRGMFGRTRTTSLIGLSVDDRDGLASALGG